MRKCLFGLPLVILCGGEILAQVTVEVTQREDQFLAGEALQAEVRITNRSGQSVKLGATEDWLTFAIESGDVAGGIVPSLSPVLVQGEFALGSPKTAIKRVDLAPHFGLNQPGRYSVTATVRIPQWNLEITSPPKIFYITRGTVLWERDVGIPDTATDAAPEVRKYALQQVNYIRSQMRLYLRVTDATGQKFQRVIPVGSMVSFSRPEPQVDRESNLHVLYQHGAFSFSYNVFNPNGDLLLRQTYDFTNNRRPRLQVDKQGNLSVIGGVRRVTEKDVPPPKPGEMLPPEAPGTNAPAPEPPPKP